MTLPADLFDPVDRLAAWLPGQLGWLPDDVRAVVVVPVVVVVVLVVVEALMIAVPLAETAYHLAPKARLPSPFV